MKENQKICLWCKTEIEREEWEYQFCDDCITNLEELETVTRRFTMTELAEIALKDFSNW